MQPLSPVQTRPQVTFGSLSSSISAGLRSDIQRLPKGEYLVIGDLLHEAQIRGRSIPAQPYFLSMFGHLIIYRHHAGDGTGQPDGALSAWAENAQPTVQVRFKNGRTESLHGNVSLADVDKLIVAGDQEIWMP